METKDRDIYELAALMTIGFNNPKKFPKSLGKFRPIKEEPERPKFSKEEREEAAGLGIEIPPYF